MTASIEIFPFSDSLEVYGEPDSLSAYSLSGHISISVSSTYSLFERCRTARILLQSLTLTFEGQTEILTPQTGYSSLRLCSISREIGPSEPCELSNEGHEDSSEPCVWNVTFNLPIPGWLPATTSYGVENTGVRYTLFAEARFTNIDDSQSSTWSFATLCSPFRSRMKSVDAQKSITLRRLILPSKDLLDPSTPSTLTYLINSPVSANSDNNKPQIPAEVLSKIQVLASVPDYVDVESNNFPLMIRMRTNGLENSECRRIQITSVAADVIQRERYRSRPPSDYIRRYPIPPLSQQPPNEPLRDAHPVSYVYDVGLCAFSTTEESGSRAFSLLLPGESGLHPLSESNYPFENNVDSLTPPTWYTLESLVPFVQRAPADKSDDWAGPSILHPSASSPFFNVQHEVTIDLMFAYQTPGSNEVATELLSFAVPIRFAHFSSNQHKQCSTPPPTHSLEMYPLSDSLSLPFSHQYAGSLPPYSQLFDSNGDRKIDYSVPLPLYTPRSSDSSPSILDTEIEWKETSENEQLLPIEFNS